MCTAIVEGNIFGRTLDLEASLGERVVQLERGYTFNYKYLGKIASDYSIIGMACIKDEVPLFFDGMNEQGVAIAALNFKGFAKYKSKTAGKVNLASFEIIPYVLSRCKSAKESRELLEALNVTADAFDASTPPTPLHWMIADSECAFVLESTDKGVSVYENYVGVLTNSPDFSYHLYNTSNYMALSAVPPINNIAKGIELMQYSRGMGAFGLPGDFSSASRFVRAVYVKNHTRLATDESKISRFFHIMDAVSQPNGCVLTDTGEPVRTVYTACMDLKGGEYHYTTYLDRRIKTLSNDRGMKR